MASDSIKQAAGDILAAALDAVEPGRAVKNALQLDGDILTVADEKIDLSAYQRIIAVGAGKAGAPMAAALEEVLGERLKAGRVVVKDGHGGPTRIIEIEEASHPVPDERGVAAGERIAELVKKNAASDTLFFCLLSGGGSALLVTPAQGISLDDKQETTRQLLACGAEIGEINAIRKHLSMQKGGGLARLAAPGRLVSLIISDVVGDRLDVIASGPTSADLSTWEDCKELLTRYKIWDKVPLSVQVRINAGLEGTLQDTPKPGDPVLEKVSNHIVAGNRQCLLHAAAKAEELGFKPLILSSTIEGETKEIARMHAAMAREVQESGNPLPSPCCIISGGETTVTLGEEPGKGGRNQEFALAAALEIEGLQDVLILSAGTDGTDGPTDAAGALATGDTVELARKKGLDPQAALAAHDAYPFFQALDDLIITGPTRTNVMDIRLVMAE